MWWRGELLIPLGFFFSFLQVGQQEVAIDEVTIIGSLGHHTMGAVLVSTTYKVRDTGKLSDCRFLQTIIGDDNV